MASFMEQYRQKEQNARIAQDVQNYNRRVNRALKAHPELAGILPGLIKVSDLKARHSTGPSNQQGEVNYSDLFFELNVLKKANAKTLSNVKTTEAGGRYTEFTEIYNTELRSLIASRVEKANENAGPNEGRRDRVGTFNPMNATTKAINIFTSSTRNMAGISYFSQTDENYYNSWLKAYELYIEANLPTRINEIMFNVHGNASPGYWWSIAGRKSPLYIDYMYTDGTMEWISRAGKYVISLGLVSNADSDENGLSSLEYLSQFLENM